MKLHPRTQTTPTTRGVSPVIGSILMLVMVVMLVSIGGGAILSQYDTPQGEPSADLKFDQTVEDTTYETSNVYVTAVSLHNADNVNYTYTGTHNLLDEDNGPYIGYRNQTTGAIDTPNDADFNASNIKLTQSGDELIIYNASTNLQFSLYAENKRGQIQLTRYTVRYVGPNTLAPPQNT